MEGIAAGTKAMTAHESTAGHTSSAANGPFLHRVHTCMLAASCCWRRVRAQGARRQVRALVGGLRASALGVAHAVEGGRVHVVEKTHRFFLSLSSLLLYFLFFAISLLYFLYFTFFRQLKHAWATSCWVSPAAAVSPVKRATLAVEEGTASADATDFEMGYLHSCSQSELTVDLLCQHARAPHAYFAAPVRGRKAV